MSFESIFDPDNPHHNNNQFIGFLIGIVLDLDDPQKLLRVKISVPTIAPEEPFPNGNDGWVPCMQRFSGAESPGGSADPLHVGDQVVLLPQAGDLRSLIVMGVLPSTVDRPSPHVDRLKKVYGQHSPGGKIELHDDLNDRSLISHASGLREKTDERGSKTIETANGGRIFLGEDGTIDLENKESFYRLDNQGRVKVGNNNSSFAIDSQGKVNLNLADSSEINFSGWGTEIAGQQSKIARIGRDIQQNLAGVTGISQQWSDRLTGIIAILETKDTTAIYQLDALLEEMIPCLASIDRGELALEELTAQEPAAIGEKIVAEIDLYRQIEGIKLTQSIQNGIKHDNLRESLGKIFGEEILISANPDWELLKTNITAVSSENQLEVILNTFFPNAFEGIIGTGLHRATDFLESLERNLDDLNIEEILQAIDLLEAAGTEGSFTWEIERLNLTIKDIPLPKSVINTISMVASVKIAIARLETFKAKVKENITQAQELMERIGNLAADNNWAIAWGTTIQSLASQTKNNLSGIRAILPGIIELEKLTTILLQMQQIDEIPEIDSLTPLIPLLEKHFTVTELRSILEEDFNLIDDVERRITAYLERFIPAVIIPAAHQIQTAIANLSLAKDNVRELERQLSTKTKGGGMVANADKIQLRADGGNLQGEIIADSKSAMLSGPGGNRGVGSQIIANQKDFTLKGSGGDLGLAASITGSDRSLELKAPGADLGLGCFFRLNQEQAYFFAPGGITGTGSSGYFDAERIGLYAPGGLTGIGSSLTLTQKKGVFCAPGVNQNGSKVVADIEKLGLYAPGGEQKAGSRIILEPEQITLKTSSVLGAYAIFKEREIEISTPLSGNRILLSSDRISLNLGLNANLHLTNFGIFLQSFGHFVSINGAGVQIDGVPLIPGGNIW